MKVLLTFSGALPPFSESGLAFCRWLGACYRGRHPLLAGASSPRTSDAQRPALPPYATWLPVVGHGSREHHRRHQHHPTPSLCPMRFRAHRTGESFFFVSFHKSDRRTKGVHRIDRLNHHAQRAGIVRSTAETGDQRVRSQKRKPKSDMIFSQCPPPSSSYGRTHPASPNPPHKPDCPCKQATNDIVPSRQPVGQPSPPSTTTSPARAPATAPADDNARHNNRWPPLGAPTVSSTPIPPAPAYPPAFPSSICGKPRFGTPPPTRVRTG